jgi:hypothetical protein
MSPRRAAVVLFVVGLVLIPGPAYAIGLDRLDGPDRHRRSAGYVAVPIDVSNDTLLTERYGNELSFQPQDMQYRHVAERYRQPNVTRDVLERAIRTGTARSVDPAVGVDLRRVERNHSFLTPSFDRFFAYDVSGRGNTTTVTTTLANDSDVAAVVRRELVSEYSQLSPAERETFRKVRDATRSEERHDYRPWSDEPVPERPIVERDETHYAVEVRSHTDDFGFPDGFLLGVAGSAVGIVAIVASACLWLYGWWRDRA